MANVTFRTFQAQPPTPPKTFKEITEHAQRFLEDNYNLDFDQPKSQTVVHNHVNLATPPQSSPQQATPGSSKQSKEVRFTQLPFLDDCPSSLRPILPSKGLKSAKSILKPHDPSPSHQPISDPFLYHETKSTFKNMLESALQMLEGKDLISRHDAYRVLNSSIRAQNDVPDPSKLREKLPIFEEFMRRDIAESQTLHPVKDLTLPALKLAMTLIRLKCSKAGGFPLEFYAFLTDQALAIIKHPSPRKDLATHFLQFLSFRPMFRKVFTSERINDLLASLQDVHERVNSKSVVPLRLTIYHSLLTQHPSSLADKPDIWLHHVFHGMLAENPDLRDRAIEVAIAAGEVFGNHRSISQTVFSLLNQEGAKYQDHFEKVLVKSMEDNETARSVPQIWGAVMLLLRGDKDMLETWVCSSSWLKIVEECFNSSDIHLNVAAFLAWNRTIFALGSSISCKPHIIVKLRKPVIGHLVRPKLPIRVRIHAFSTLCALLYHSFRPGISQENMSLCWKLYVQEIFTKILEKSSVNVSQLAKILSALLFNSNVRVWSADRALKTASVPFKLEEVPRLDTQWIRTNIERVSKVVLVVLEKLSQLPKSEENTLEELWASFLRAIVDAGSKEIKLSIESKRAYAEITNTLHRLWQMAFLKSGENTVSDSESTRTYISLVRSAVQILGPIHLSETILARTNGDAFEAAPTPSRHTPSRSNVLLAPIIVLLKPLFQISVHDDNATNTDIHDILYPCWEARGSRGLRIAFGKNCCHMLSPQQIVHGVHTMGSHVWKCIVNLTTTALGKDVSVLNDEPLKFGHPLSDAVDILRFGLQFSDPASVEAGSKLFKSISRCAKAVAGDAGMVLIVIESLVKHLDRSTDGCTDNMRICYVTAILNEGMNIPSQRSLDSAKKTLWDHPFPTQDATGLQWLSSFYSSINQCLTKAYFNSCNITSLETHAFFSALTAFLNDQSGKARSAVPGVELFFWNLSEGICLWIEDKDGKVPDQKVSTIDIRAAVEKLWTSILLIISKFPIKTKVQLNLVEAILCSGLQSRSKAIANSTIVAWNNTFGAEERLEYPTRLFRIFQSLRRLVDISLPTFPADISDELESHDIDTIGVQNRTVQFRWLNAVDDAELEVETGFKVNKHVSLSSRPSGGFLLQPTPAPETSSASSILSGANGKSTPPPRLRHDDSKVEYVAVNLSPQDGTDLNSRILTENQEEVRIRQRVELNLFQGVKSSSPITTPLSSELPAKRSNAEGSIRQALSGFDDMSPVDNDDMSDLSDVADMSDSSPLSRSQRSSSLPFARTPVRGMPLLRMSVPNEVVDVPSSPPDLSNEDGMATNNLIILNKTATTANSLPLNLQDFDQTYVSLENQISNAPDACVIEKISKETRNEMPDGCQSTSLFPTVNTMIENEEAPVEENTATAKDAGHAFPTNEIAPKNLNGCEMDFQASESHLLSSDCEEDKSYEDFELSHVQRVTEDEKDYLNETIAPALDATDALGIDLSSNHPTSIVLDSFSESNSASVQVDSNADEDLSQNEQDIDPTASPPLTGTSRMIATHVLIPSPVSKQDYEDFSQSQTDKHTAYTQPRPEGSSKSKKRKSLSPILEVTSKKQKKANNSIVRSTITVRPKGPNSPSLRSLVMDSALLVDMNVLVNTPFRASQKASSSQSRSHKNRKRRASTVENTGDLDELLISQQSSLRRSVSKKQKLSTSSEMSLAGPASQSSQRRSSRLFGESIQIKDGLAPKTRTRGTTLNTSPSSAAHTPVETVHVAQQSIIACSSSDGEFLAGQETGQMQNRDMQKMQPPPHNTKSSSYLTTIKPAHGGINHLQVLQSDDASDVTDHSLRLERREEAVVLEDSPWNDTTVDVTTLAVPGAPVNLANSTSEFCATMRPQGLRNMAQTTNFGANVHEMAETTSPGMARSIIDRLRGILVDCKNLVLGSGYDLEKGESEFEEMQDLAHELQGEILKASRRSRAA